MNSERRALGRKLLPLAVAIPVALLLGAVCLPLLDQSDSPEPERAAHAPAAARVAAAPTRALALTPPAPALVPAAPPEEVALAGPGVAMTFKDWQQKRIARTQWEQKQREVAIYQAREKQRPAWMDKNVFALSKELQELDRLSAQRLLASRFAKTEQNTPQLAGLHQVDYQLGLEAWKLHLGGVKPNPEWADQKTEPLHSLEPSQILAHSRHRRRRSSRRRARQAQAQ